MKYWPPSDFHTWTSFFTLHILSSDGLIPRVLSLEFHPYITYKAFTCNVSQARWTQNWSQLPLKIQTSSLSFPSSTSSSAFPLLFLLLYGCYGLSNLCGLKLVQFHLISKQTNQKLLPPSSFDLSWNSPTLNQIYFTLSDTDIFIEFLLDSKDLTHCFYKLKIKWDSLNSNSLHGCINLVTWISKSFISILKLMNLNPRKAQVFSPKWSSYKFADPTQKRLSFWSTLLSTLGLIFLRKKN